MPTPLSTIPTGDDRSPRNAGREDLLASRTVCRFCRSVFPKGTAPPGWCRGAQGGEAPGSGWFCLDLPQQRGFRKEHEKDEIREISRDGRMTSGWAATSPYVRLLRCLYSMQRLCPKQGCQVDPRRISGLRRNPPLSRPARIPVRLLLTCNCFLSLMAFLQSAGAWS